ncbi:hypothetical protein [Falsiroseomonas tokyonensis]|uniref:DUF2336 domain-containing protein n=1 Tax=Falsiroseomonas tokyonensis TaxID=430521 RepID=A0ABV7BL36_9PROT|nr:hypothetical protein [Falsiroseomonas tokyonensis]MBU8536242.1 hypothetical protein [Falsiroseomonas tokyonensis]
MPAITAAKPPVPPPAAARTTLAALSAAAAEPAGAPPRGLLAAALPPRAEPQAQPVHELGPLAALLNLAPAAPPALPLGLPPGLPPAPRPAPPAEPAAPSGGLLSFLAQQAPPQPAPAIWEGPLLSALGAAPLQPPQAPPTPEAPISEAPLPGPAPAQALASAEAILASKPVLKSAAQAPVPPSKPRLAPPAKPAEPDADPLAPAQIAAAYEAVHGSAMPAEAAGDGADWLGLARSLDEAKESWRALFLGASQADLPLAGALAARGRGLAPVLHATESHPGNFRRLLAALEAKGLQAGETRLLQAAVTTDPDSLPPGGALVQGLLERQEAWDYVRVSGPRVIGGLLKRAQPLLDARVRWMMLRLETRAQEAAAIKGLGAAKWKLVAERPARLQPGLPVTTAQPGIQLWRGPLA